MPRRTTGVLDFLALMLVLLSFGLVSYGSVADWWTRPIPGLTAYADAVARLPGAPDLFSESRSLLEVTPTLAWTMIVVLGITIILLGLVEGPYMLWKRRPVELLAGCVGVAGAIATIYASTLDPVGRGWELGSNWLAVLVGWLIFTATVIFYAFSFAARVGASKRVVLVDREPGLEFSAGPDSSDG